MNHDDSTGMTQAEAARALQQHGQERTARALAVVRGLLGARPAEEGDSDDDELWEAEEDDHEQRVRTMDLLDAEGNMRVNRKRCGTCIYWDENRMHLNEGVKEQLEADAIANDVFIPCHQTLPYAPYDAPPAVCHGYYQVAKDRVWTMRWARMRDAIAKVDPPSTEWNGKGWATEEPPCA